MPKYTIAMATYDDYNGVFFTVQALRMYQDLEDCEIIILDNNPQGPESQDVRNLVSHAANTSLPIRYFEFEGNNGTSATRQKLFELAQGEVVIVLDCHVLLKRGAIAKFKAFWESADDEMRKNLFTGPLLMDSMQHHQTHFECEWRSEMWGVWATAWRKDDEYWVARPIDGDVTKIQIKKLMSDKAEFELNTTWPGHEHRLKAMGFQLAGWNDEDIFEVPAQGLGLFISAKEHWLGFNQHHKYFGGEECYIHEKYRLAGRKTYCLPFMQWNHRFGRPGGIKYPISREGKMRNYVLEFQELGLDVEQVRKHFVEDTEVKIPLAVWDKCIADPIKFDPYSAWGPGTAPSNSKPVMKSNLGMFLPLHVDDLTGMAVEVANKPRDSEQHFPKIMEYGMKCNSILEFNKRREVTLFWATALNKKQCKGSCSKAECDCKSRFLSYQSEQDTLLSMISDAVKVGKGRLEKYENKPYKIGSPLPEIKESFDLLYLDDLHTYSRLAETLSKYGSRINKYIVIRGATPQVAGKVGEDKKSPGTLHAIKMFIKANPDWYVAYHTPNQWGFTVLSCVADERPETVIRPWPMSDDEGQPCGAGQELKSILKSLGIEASEQCSCNAFAAKMDEQGPDKCEEEIEQILDWLKEQADARKLSKFFFRPAVKIAVKQAIKRARKKLAKGLCS